MPFEWEEIQSKWLFNLPSPFPQDEIVKAFNSVEQEFGSTFFDSYNWLRGTYIVTLVSDLDKIIEEVKKGNCKLPEKGEVINQIKDNKIHLASLVIRSAAHYLRHGLSVEFEPEIGKRKPDLRVKFGGTWVYIEESKLEFSNRFKVLSKVMDKISETIETINSNLNVEVLLQKEDLDAIEIKKIIYEIRHSSKSSNQPQDVEIEDLARIITYNKGQTKPLIEENRPALCMDSLSVGGGFERHLHVEIQFTDVRLNKILKKAKQLPSKEHNLLILDISLPGNIKEWSKIAEKTLGPQQHLRLSGILLVEEHRFIKSLKIDSKLILHPNALKPLSPDFVELTVGCFKEYSEYQYFP